MIPEKEREALMRLTMCARNECQICKYCHEYNNVQCRELQTKCMSILANALEEAVRSKRMKMLQLFFQSQDTYEEDKEQENERKQEEDR